ncbi:hypothetical protein HDU83_005395, partial [Entophlyctis luteolus]
MVPIRLDNGPFGPCDFITSGLLYIGFGNNSIRREDELKKLLEEVRRVLRDKTESNVGRALNDAAVIPHGDRYTVVLNQKLAPLDVTDQIISREYSRQPGTRDWLLNSITDWLSDNDGKRVFWLQGVAGSGKSVVYACVTQEFRRIDKLIATFMCNHSVADQSNPRRLLLTLAWQIALIVPPSVREQMSMTPAETLEKGPLSALFDRLIVDPLRHYSGERRVVTIDALDECAPPNSAARKELLKLLAENWKKVPDNMRLLVTSRPSDDIVSIFADHTPFVLDLNEERNLADLSSFSLHRMTQLKHLLPRHRQSQTGELATTVAKAACGLFVWIVLAYDDVICKAADVWTAVQEVQQMGSGTATSMQALGDLYQRTFRVAYHGWSSDAREQYRTVLGSMVHLRRAISEKGLASLLMMPEHLIRRCLVPIHSLLNISGGKVQFMHKSVADHLSSQEGAELRLDAAECETLLCKGCISLLYQNDAQIKIRAWRLLMGYESADGLDEALVYAIEQWSEHFATAKPLLGQWPEWLALLSAESLGPSIFWFAVIRGRPDILEHLVSPQNPGKVELLARAHRLRLFQNPPFYEAARRGHARVVDLLLSQTEADINYQNSKDKSTALHVAAVVRAVDVIRVLLKHDANTCVKDEDGREAATFWKGVFDVEQRSFDVSRQPEKMVSALFVQIVSTHSNPQPPLLYAIYLGQIEKVREFVEHGTFMNECNKVDEATNLTPIGLACEIGNPDIVQLLFRSGAKVNTDVDGVDGPQHIAARIGNTIILQMLKAFGANFQAK